MRLILALPLVLAACSTVQSRQDQAPLFEQQTQTSAQAFAGCFSGKTSNQQVNYLPRSNGGSFSAGAGPQLYVFWVVNVDDLGSSRRVSVYAVNSKVAQKDAIPAVEACL